MFGQIFTSNSQISIYADYLQFSISGLSPKEIKEKIGKVVYKNSRVILHGDWENKSSPNVILDLERWSEYREIVEIMSDLNFEVLGITLHPPNKVIKLDEFVTYLNKQSLNFPCPVTLENRSKNPILSSLKQINCIIDHQTNFLLTIDIPGILISNFYQYGKQKSKFGFMDISKTIYDNLNQLQKESKVLEVHVGDIKLSKTNRFQVAQKIGSGIIDFRFIKNSYDITKLYTLEVLGGKLAFEESLKFLQKQ